MKIKDTSRFFITSLYLTSLTSLAFRHPAQIHAITQPTAAELQNQVARDLLSSFQNTGEEVSFGQQETQQTEVQVNQDQTADITQSTNAVANTGYNQANRNISIGGNAGVIQTGNALIGQTAVVEANGLTTQILTPQLSAGDSGWQVNNTGDSLTNTQTNNDLQTVLINGQQTTVINQSTNSQANTGHNVADRNISIGGVSGLIQTGTAATDVSYLVTANQSVALVGGAGAENGPGTGASIVLANTGDNAAVDKGRHRLHHTAIENDQAAFVTQSCGQGNALCTAITGGNTSNRGINKQGDAGVIQTGAAEVNLDFWTLVNPNSSQLSYSLIPSSSVAQSSVNNTGDQVSATDTALTQNTLAVNNNQNAYVTQIANATADTGHNTADRNISFGGNAGVIRTGNAVIDILMHVIANPTEIQAAQ